jgi:hypothetical protein
MYVIIIKICRFFFAKVFSLQKIKFYSFEVFINMTFIPMTLNTYSILLRQYSGFIKFVYFWGKFITRLVQTWLYQYRESKISIYWILLILLAVLPLVLVLCPLVGRWFLWRFPLRQLILINRLMFFCVWFISSWSIPGAFFFKFVKIAFRLSCLFVLMLFNFEFIEIPISSQICFALFLFIPFILIRFQ